jgi:hypothetical protein
MKNLLWKAFAFVVSRKPVADYLIKRSQRTPYFHLDGYMNRWWLFNPYSPEVAKENTERYKRKLPSWVPSIRVHHILREDLGRHFHDHPWDARTIILKGWYTERRLEDMITYRGRGDRGGYLEGLEREYMRSKGHTATINYGEYHTIDEVSEGGVFTLFFTWKYCGGWGFLVDGKKVPWREYENA